MAKPKLHWAMEAAERVKQSITRLERRDVTGNLVHLGTVYGVLSLAYYRHDTPLTDDATYDFLCKHLSDHADLALIDGASKFIIDEGALAAGSGYQFAAERLPGYAAGIVDIYTCINLIKAGWVALAERPATPIRKAEYDALSDNPAPAAPARTRERVRATPPTQAPRVRERSPAAPVAPRERTRNR